jgi:hypothetical protein
MSCFGDICFRVDFLEVNMFGVLAVDLAANNNNNNNNKADESRTSVHNTPIHNILLTAPQLSITQKALGTLPEDNNVMPKHVEDTIHN